MNSLPLVSVAVITYNQQDYIEKALKSVLSQETDFAFEVIVGDDSSTDGTTAICERLAKEYPHLKHVYNKSNLGYVENLLNVISLCSGEYVALLEADDHWVSMTKLKDQVGVFKNHPTVSLCFTNSAVDDSKVPERRQYFDRAADEVYTAADVLKFCLAPTSSFMFKRAFFTQPPSWFKDVTLYEYNLIFIMAGKGDIYYLNQITSCRTQHYRGLSFTTERGHRALMSDATYRKKIIQEYAKPLERKVRNSVLGHQIWTAEVFVSHNDLPLAKQLIRNIDVGKTTFQNQGGFVIKQYVKLLAKYWLVKLGIRRPKYSNDY